MPDTPAVVLCSGCPHCVAELDAVRRDIADSRREHSRWSAFGSAAGTAVVLTLWHLFAHLTRMQ